MSGTMRLKKPRREIEIESVEEDKNSQKSSRSDDESESISSRDEEEALVLLFEHRSKEVQHLRTRVLYYQSQLEEAERKLQDTEGKLARVRRKASHKSWNSSLPSSKKVKVERRSTSPSERNEDSSHYLSWSKPQLLIPNLNPKSSWPKPVAETGAGVPSSPSDRPIKSMVDRSHTAHDECDDTKYQALSSKRKAGSHFGGLILFFLHTMNAELRECNEWVPLVRSCSSPSMIQCNASTYISSQHKRKLRSLALCPVSDKLFITRTPERQLRLFDIRLNNSELHAFGWKQESSEQQSALINQAWSPDGLCISSGSADPVIHIFDIRYYSNKPSESLKAHQKRVFKAEWHKSLPFLISISSDLTIGLHKILIG
ncbi:hypothetical protein Cgig2_013915 [Carnegiea gigantea]|uniref:Uncharacterized protein n=1 Tax=Carnegiea gigantea TaxID=171969 RepID=A0A9Q1JHV0_9CARY|nr:hypothetical protein Cgig2_005410 [Carnegiea gigantea]KAJ8425569.1 hypothetical protein Cgig2_013915 [Carnegiea gigantea]